MRVDHKLVRLARKSPHQLLTDLVRFVRRPPYERAFIARRFLGTWDWRIPHLGNDRTTYIIGLFGSGRGYVNTLVLKHLGKRAKYCREMIRVHPGPTSMIYTGHATIRYVSREQSLPEVTSRMLEGVKAGSADLIFVYRHPLDSLLTNWIWWRTYIRENAQIEGVSQVYQNADDLSADLEKNFSDFKSFAEGDPNFYAELPGPRFLSFSEFVEETELYLQTEPLALRLEDFMIDPCKEFCKIVQLMSVELDPSRLCLERPKTKPYGYLSIREKVRPFKAFIDGLDAETKRRIERIGYGV
jgi:hypothetical protein